MNSLLIKYLVTIIICFVVANVAALTYGYDFYQKAVLAVNLFYFLPITFIFIILWLIKIALRQEA